METVSLRGRHATIAFIHGVLMVSGFYILVQDLIAENLANAKTVYQVVKYVDEALYAFLFLVILTMRLSRGKLLKPVNIDFILFAFLSIAIASSIAANVPLEVSASQLILYLKGFFLFYVIVQSGITIGLVGNYVTFFFWAGILFLFFGVIDFFIPLQFRAAIGHTPGIEYRNGLPTVKSLFFHPVYYSWFMNFIALFCFAFFLNSRRVMYAAVGFLFVLGSLSAQRVKAIVGLAVGVMSGILFIPEKKHGKNGILLVLGLVLLMLVFLPAMFNLLEYNLATYFLGDDVEDTPRDVLYLRSIEIANDFFPFGAGLGRYGSYTSKVYYSPIYERYGISHIVGLSEDVSSFIADTFWPMVAGETGWFGACLYFVILVVFLVSIVGFMKRTTDSRVRTFHLGTLMILVESIVESIAQPIYVAPPPNFFVFGAIGISYALYAHTRQRPEADFSRDIKK